MSQCKILWFEDHNFDQWKIVEESNIVRGSDKGVIGKIVLQARKCKKCGLTEFKKEKMNLL